MSYVKNYEIGNTRLDNTYKNFVHELPLLSFGDACNTFALSLLFQSRLTGNPFYIVNGYRLNLQKRIIFSSGFPSCYEDGDGKTYKILRISGNPGKFAFDDRSYRFIRIIKGLYVLENPDYSTETFDSNGNIISIKDKYSNTILSYTYSSGKLTSISFKGRKTVSIGYNDNALQYIQYIYSDTTYTTTFAYSNNSITVNHYSGVSYHLDYSSGIFEIYSADEGEAFSNDHSYKNKAIAEGDVITIERYIGDKEIDRVVYCYYLDNADERVTFLDITNRNYVSTRVQIVDGKPAYAYETLDTMFVAHPSSDDYSYYPGRVTFYNNERAIGYQDHDDGVTMTFEGTSESTSNGYSMLHEFSGMMTVSGWLRPIDDITECTVTITDTYGNVLASKTVSGLNQGDWAYFSISFYQENDAVVHARVSQSVTIIESRDFRLTGQNYSAADYAEYKDNLLKSAGIVIYTDDSGNDHAIPINSDIEYFNGDISISNTDYPITANDLMRYKINQAIGTNTEEMYYNDGRGILQLNGGLYLRYDIGDDTITADLNTLAIGKMYSSKGNVYLTKTNFYTENEVTKLKTESFKNSVKTSTEIYDEKLDLIETTANGINTTYDRNASTGLVTNKTVKDPTAPQDITKSLITSAVYDTNDFLVSTTDEFGVVTTYTTDATWGIVTKSVVTEASTVIDTVTDEFDSDGSALTSREFGADPTTKLHTFAYSNGRLSSMQNGALTYTMGYSADILSSVAKNSQLMCEFSTEENIYSGKTDKAFYPNSSTPSYTLTQIYDKYDRLKEIENLIANTYSIDPVCSNGTYSALGVDNGSAKLATSTDKTNNNVTKYGYKNDRVSSIGVFNSSGTKLSEESFNYDENGKLISDEFSYNNSYDSVKQNISYVVPDDSNADDSKISSYSYTVGNDVKSTVQNRYNDTFKRLSEKLTTIGSCTYDRVLTYDKTRISKVTDVKNGSTIHNVSYSYDPMGRITSEVDSVDTNVNTTYAYDNFGQLVRENNKALDKTFIYNYNEIGNISSVKEYAYTTEATPSGTASTKSYGYDLAQTDRLFLLGFKRITYDSLGYVKTYDGWTYTWDKGRLVSMQKSVQSSYTSTYTFTYDAYGRRTQKKHIYTPGSLTQVDYIKAETTGYTYDNSGRLVSERCVSVYNDNSTETKEFTYLYDENGIVGTMLSKNGATATPYYYHRNLQGDVTAIYDQSGTKVAEYAYDAWGNCTILYSASNTIVNNNPIRYRGYYYDRETGLYYLNARYYNPQWRRFISPDDSSYLDPETPNGLNLYCYCNNDPVNYVDPSGHFGFGAVALIGAGVLGLIGLGATIQADVSDDGTPFNGSIGADAYILNTLVAASVGALFGGLAYTFAPAISSFLGSNFALGSYALATGELVTITVSGAQIAGGAIAASLGIMLFAKGGLPNNQHQNEQWREAMRQLGIKDKDLWRRLHDEVHKHPYQRNLKDLLKLLREILEKWRK